VGSTPSSKVAARRGIAAGIADVGEAAGCSAATVFRHIASREGLLSACAAARTPRVRLGEESTAIVDLFLDGCAARGDAP
jgi:AcrR family transcriptional regulator